jgi:hypothetical protein
MYMQENSFSALQGSGLPAEAIPPMALDRFAEISGLSAVSLWRFQRRGWLRTHLISNRRYVLAADLIEFNRRLAAGEFAGAPSNLSAAHRATIHKRR